MNIEEFLTEKQIEILAYHGPRSSLVDAFVVQASDLREFMKDKVLVDAELWERVLRAAKAWGLSAEVHDAAEAILQPASSEAKA
jgi:hypothetical protein